MPRLGGPVFGLLTEGCFPSNASLGITIPVGLLGAVSSVPSPSSLADLCVLANQQLGVQLCQLSMYRYLKRVGIQRRKSTSDGNSGIPKQNRDAPTETP